MKFELSNAEIWENSDVKYWVETFVDTQLSSNFASDYGLGCNGNFK